MKEDNDNSKTGLILKQVLDYSRSKGLFDCGTVIVGLSGGPDSVALLYILNLLKERNDIACDIMAFHCNHHLRPGACDKEAEMVGKMCNDLGIKLKVLDFDCAGFARQNHVSEETAGRILRYEAFEQFAGSVEAATGKGARIAIAHHRDDISETMMMNLFRGSGLEGLVNPKPRTGRIIRPLLCLKKCELVEFLESLNIEYATDLTNLEAVGTRNVWRNRFLPEIGKYYDEDPSVPLTRTYKLLSDDLDFIGSVTSDAYRSNRSLLAGHPFLSADGINKLHPAIRSRVIRALWNETFGDLIDFEESNLKDCFSVTGDNVPGEVMLDMPFGRKAFRHGDCFAFVPEDEVLDLSCRIAENMGFLTAQGPVKIQVFPDEISGNDGLCMNIPESSLILKARIIEKDAKLEYNNCSWFCPFDESLKGGITFGNCDGIGTSFRMKKAGARGSKDLNRLMTDLKIPESGRRQVLFAEKDGNILWLPGFGHGMGFTGAVSHEKYIEGRSAEGKDPCDLILFTIERQ
ncbi:MAG: tRNA lysidine(34) synthetase TilS [Saccharofermentans sp.]|nr:tRNA lysidine(34) synthetase TilS [Saccharofermentans sp.]